MFEFCIIILTISYISGTSKVKQYITILDNYESRSSMAFKKIQIRHCSSTIFLKMSEREFSLR